MRWFNTLISVIVLPLAYAAVPAMAAIPAHPGMLNYVEGQARIDGRPVFNSNVGTADVREGQVIETGTGKAEMLLTPGVFLRLGDNSAVRLDAAGLTNTRVALLRGHAMIEADNLQKGNNISVLDDGAVSRIEKNGIYSFTANPREVATYDGKLAVTANDKTVELGKGHETNPQGLLTSAKFDVKANKSDPLYQWSSVRSQYVAEANVDVASNLGWNQSAWMGAGWYWDPWFAMYSWIPGDGMFWSPFGYGWGFYSPFTVWQSPIIVRRGFVGGRGFAGAYRAPAFRGGAVGMGRIGGGGMGRIGGGGMGHFGGRR
ncbi:MAG TPA: hypothetical protein VGL72_00230 [Bryobacteraceae bacterium]